MKRRSAERTTKGQLQPPFREKDLLTVETFIQQCSDYGIRTDREESEYFEKEGLLFPAIRVYRGVVAYKKVFADFAGKGRQEWRECFKSDLSKIRRQYRVKKVDPKTYYRPGAISMGQQGWLDWFKKRKMVAHPAGEAFRPWAEYRIPDPGDITDPASLENVCETFYTRMQMYPLRHLQHSQALRIVNEALYQPAEAWASLGEEVAAAFDRQCLYPSLRAMVARHYRFCKLFGGIEALWEQRNSRLSGYWREAEDESKGKDYERSQREKVDDLRHHIIVVNADVAPLAKKMLRRSGYSIKDLEMQRMSFLWYGTFGKASDSGRRARPYLAKIEDADLAQAEDPYRIVYILSWFIKLCGGKERSLKELIIGFSGKHCVVCYRIFTPRRPSVQVTCGDPSCKAEYKNRLKRLARKAGRYS